jgi:hypothetical protein
MKGKLEKLKFYAVTPKATSKIIKELLLMQTKMTK